jgi:Strictosidine synthase
VRAAVAVAVVLVSACGAGAAPARERDASLSRPPADLRPGAVWRATLSVRTGAPARLELTARNAELTRRFAARRSADGRYAAALVFPGTGAWRISVRLSGVVVPLRTVSVRLPIVEPYRVVAEPAGSLLVADGGGGGGRIIRNDPRSGRRSVVAGTGGRSFAGVGGPAVRASLGRVFTVAVGPAGSIYAVASGRLLRVDSGGRLQVVAAGIGDAIGLAVDGAGDLLVGQLEAGRILHVDADTGRQTTIASGLAGPAGISLDRDGSLLVAEGPAKRVVRVGRDGAVAAVATGLEFPIYAERAPDGAVFVVDHSEHHGLGRILRLGDDGRLQTLADRTILAPTSVTFSAGRVYVSSFSRGVPIGRLGPDGRVLPLP